MFSTLGALFTWEHKQLLFTPLSLSLLWYLLPHYHPQHRSATPTDEEETGDEVTAEVEEFNKKLKKFHESKGTPMVRRPTLGQKDLNLFKLYKLVKENGGMEKVTQELKWRSLYLQMGMPSMTNASYAIKQAYKKWVKISHKCLHVLVSHHRIIALVCSVMKV